jgi:predicted glycosyl hydrolase (DUF1957 family)
MKQETKYRYLKVIQQSTGQGWEDVSEYETDSQYRNFEKSGCFFINKYGRRQEYSLIGWDLKEYRFTGYPTRLINRKELRQVETN